MPLSGQLRAFGPHIDGVEGLAGGHKEAFLLVLSPETNHQKRYSWRSAFNGSIWAALRAGT